jgi:Acyl-CoA dehydrogenase, C-terminal domain
MLDLTPGQEEIRRVCRGAPRRRRLRHQRPEELDLERRRGRLRGRLHHGRARQRHRGITAFVLFSSTRVRVPADRRLGEEGQGFRALMETFDRSRVTLGASATGLARAALEYATDYARERVQFGKPIAEH